MKFLMQIFSWRPFGPRPRLKVRKGVWADGVAVLRRKAGGVRESGAFLLGRRQGQQAFIDRFVFYDDLDPDCLRHGAISFNGRRLGLLWDICKSSGLEVVADVHLHPGGYGQSKIDQDNPMMPSAGHLALIIPYYATKATEPGGIGIYEFMGAKTWADHTRLGKHFMKVTK